MIGNSQVGSFYSCGRISSYTSPEGTVSFDYDDNGNAWRVRDSHGNITRTFDVLNRVTSYTDTYGNTIGYEYDEVGDLRKLTYPDNTYVSYEYDENHNLKKVTDWASRVTEYGYDKNNRVTSVIKPNGTTVTTTYERNKVKTTVEKTAAGAIITGFEYTYDNLSRIVEEKVLANSTKMCYTYIFFADHCKFPNFFFNNKKVIANNNIRAREKSRRRRVRCSDGHATSASMTYIHFFLTVYIWRGRISRDIICILSICLSMW